MWCWKLNIIFIYIFCIHRVYGTEKSRCNHNYYDFKFNQTNEVDDPASLSLELDVSNQDEPPKWRIGLINRTDDFNFTLLFNPMVDKQTSLREEDCPLLEATETQDLRRYKKTCTVFKDADENILENFNHIYSGCYYFIMTNAKGHNWEQGPVVPNSSYKYRDTELKFIKGNFVPEKTNEGRRLRTQLKIPLSCIKIVVELYQIDGNVDAMDDIEKYKTEGSQRCYIEKKNLSVAFDCIKSPLITKLGIGVLLTTVNGEEWTIVITWIELQDAGGTYYLRLVSDIDECEETVAIEQALNTWKPIKRNNLIQLGYQNPIPTLPTPEPNTVYYISFIILLVCILLGITVILVLAYRREHPEKPEPELNQPLSEIPCTGYTNEKKSDHILLMYARDSDRFNRLMEDFRTSLAETCDCHVYDLYAKEDWKYIAHLGAAEWIAKQLEDGCRVIWVDTPRFRLQLNNQQDQHTTSDFRAWAVSKGVKLAKSLYVDATTQYTRHFVVCMKGFEPMDRDAGPLRTVSSYARFYIPGQISQLYRELKESMQVVVHPTE